jgi:hypothetical protein
VPVWTWVALGVFVAVLVPASVFAGVTAFGLFRTLGRSGRALEAAATDLAVRAERAAERAEALEAGRQRLDESLARLAASRRQLETLAWAFEDVRRLLRVLRWLTPAK